MKISKNENDLSWILKRMKFFQLAPAASTFPLKKKRGISRVRSTEVHDWRPDAKPQPGPRLLPDQSSAS
jgi:hypothetical protein